MRIMKKLSKIGIAMSLVFAFLLMCMQPLTNVLADGTYTVVLTFEVVDSSDVTLTARIGPDNVAPGVEGDSLIGTRGEHDNFIGFEDTTDHTSFSSENVRVVCESDTRCNVTITVPNEHGVKAAIGGDTPFKFMMDGREYNAGSDNITSNKVLEIVNFDDDRESFDGKAYLIWACGNGTCYHLFTGITEEPMFISSSTIKADNDGSKIFDVHASYKTFASKTNFEEWQEEYKTYKNMSTIDFSTLDTKEVIEPLDMREYEEDAIKDGVCTKEDTDREDFEHCVDGYVASKGIFNRRAGYQPVGEPYSENAYVSYGDRNFKITIYNEDYCGITLGSLEDLEYYPAVWNDPFLRMESYDISGNDMDNATIIETTLLEPTINIKALAYNNFEIKSIDAMDVPENAVTVAKDSDQFKIRFASHFYDNVLFKVTTTNNKVYYFRIVRLTIDANIRHDNKGAFIAADFYFDNKSSYKDYKLTAKIVYKDGTFKRVELENAKEIDNGLGDKTFAYELDQETITEGPKGKGLKVASYKYAITRDEEEKISKVYITVENVGGSKDVYAGAYAGSGKGVLLNVEEDYR